MDFLYKQCFHFADLLHFIALILGKFSGQLVGHVRRKDMRSSRRALSLWFRTDSKQAVTVCE